MTTDYGGRFRTTPSSLFIIIIAMQYGKYYRYKKKNGVSDKTIQIAEYWVEEGKDN